MTTSSTRSWVIGGVVAALLLVAVTWLLVISPARSSAQTLRDDKLNVEQQNLVLLTKSNALKKQAENRAQLETDVRSALDQLPDDVSLPDFNKELAGHAAAQGVTLSSITVGAAAAPTATTTAAPAGLLAVPITVQTRGSALAQLYFLRDIQQTGPRAALVTSTSLTALEDTDIETASTMTLQLDRKSVV